MRRPRQDPSAHWKVKQLSRELGELRRLVEELRAGRDLKRWPKIIDELHAAQVAAQAAQAALRKVVKERDDLLAAFVGPH